MHNLLNNNNLFWKDVVVMILILILPFAFFLYNFIPLNIKLFKIAWLEIDSGLHADVNQYFWFLSIKMLTLFLLSIWFVTCKYRWRRIIFVPIIVEIYKINVLVQLSKSSHNSEQVYLESLIYSLPFVFTLILISIKMGYQKRYSHEMTMVNEEINNELVKLSKFEITNYKAVKKELKALQKLKPELNKKDYLMQLISLRDRLSSL